MMKRAGSVAFTVFLCAIVAGCGGPDTSSHQEALALAEGLQNSVGQSPGDASGDGGAEERDACSLVTREELERIVGGALHEGELDRDKCTYHAKVPDGAVGWHTVTITARWYGAESEMQTWRTATGMMDDRMQASEGASTVSGDDLNGIGDDAFFASAGIMDFLLVRKGDAFVRIEGVGPQEQTIAIARLAVERL